MTTLSSLPPEVLTRIFLKLPAKDCVNLAKTCRFTNDISKIEFIWENKIQTDFGIDVKKEEQSGPSTRAFYWQVLQKYGKLLGLWQATTYGHRGGLFQGVFHNWTLKVIEWFPPVHQPNEPMRPKEFLTIKLHDISENDQKDEKYKCNFLLHYCDWNSLDAEFENDEVQFFMLFGNKGKPKANLGIENALSSVFSGGLFGKKKDSKESQPVEKSDEDKYFHLNFPSTYRNILGPDMEDFQHNDIPYVSDNYHILNFLRNSEIGRTGIRLERLNLENILKSNEPSEKKPIPPGIFKGNYGALPWGHGIEIIAINYPSSDTLEAVKLTGDPNVPMNKITFKADLQKCIFLPKEEQRRLYCAALEDSDNLNFESPSNQCSQAFLLPPDARLDFPIEPEYNQCLHRFFGEAQVAAHNYFNPKMIPAHIIMFDNDTLGVIFLHLRSMSIYKRMKEDLSVIHYNDIFRTE